MFLGAVTKPSEERWTVPVQVDGREITFRVDTGTDVSIMEKAVFAKKLPRVSLKPTSQTICGADHRVIKTHIFFQGNVCLKEKLTLR